MKIKKHTLLCVAGALWLIAGVNILRIGAGALLGSSAHGMIWLMCVGALAVFAGFMLMFRHIVDKHKRRILAYLEESRSVWDCFDRKGYVLMVFMMTLGIVLRRVAQLPPAFFAVFYTGLGAALSVSGLMFIRAGAGVK